MANPTWDETEETESSAVPTWDDTEEATPVETSFSDKAKAFVNAPSPLGPSLADTAKTVQDFGIGAAQGATLGAADEIGGGLAALLEKGAGKLGFGPAAVDEQLEAQGFEVPGTSLEDTYRDYQKGSEQAFKAAGDRSPVANTLGNLGGSVASGTALGGALGIGSKAKNAQSAWDIYKSQGKLNAAADLLKKGATTYAKAAPAIAAESALVSEGNLSNEQGREKLGKDVLSGLGTGLPVVLGMEGLTEVAAPAAKAGLNAIDDKFSKFVQDTPFLRKYGIGIKHGEMGTKPTTEGGLKNLENLEKIRTQGMLDNVYQANDKLGAEVGQSISDATSRGVQVNTAAPIQKSIQELQFTPQKLQTISDEVGSRGNNILGKINSFLNKTASPSETHELINDIDAFIGKFDATRMKTQSDDDILDILHSVRKNMSEQLKTDVPEYRQAAQRFAEYRQYVPETILSKSTPSDISGVFMGNLKNAEGKLYKGLEELQSGATAQGSGGKPGRNAYDNLLKGMREFEFKEKLRNEDLIKQGKAPNSNPLAQSSDEFEKTMSGFSDEANFLKDVQTVKSPFVTGQNLISQVGQMGHSGALSTSLLVGRAKKPIQEISRKAYNMAPQKLGELATKMKASPGLKILGQALEDGLANGDQAKKNAAIFSILQNPEARLYLDNEDEN